MKKSLVFIYPLISLLILSACMPAEDVHQPGAGSQLSPDDDLTVERASEIIGLPIPVPEYLPSGYEISSVRIANPSQPPGPWWNITLMIENGEPSESITLEEQGFGLGLKLPPGVETVKIGDSTAWVSRDANGVRLTWTGKYGRTLMLSGGAEVQFDELVRIAESVTSPPSQVLERRLEPAGDLLVLRGQSQRISVHLTNNSTKSLQITVSQEHDLPKGIVVNVVNGALTLKPRETVDVPVDVKVGADAQSPSWPHVDASSVLSTDPAGVPPPTGSHTEEPYYFLQFMVYCRYVTYGSASVNDNRGFSTNLRIDPPPVLPAGMVTLKEAEAAADFPVAMLLPSYFPEGASPPPIGYSISSEEPHSITAHYSAFDVVLSPEPGVTAPDSFVGERTTIRTKQVIIGDGRIDWWVYDIHFAVISDQVPMAELKLVAESMMLIGVYSGSWLGVGP